MGKGMAIVFAERAFGCGPNMAKDEAGRCLGGYSLEIGAVPCRNRRGEEAGRSAELGIRIKAYAEAIGIVLAATSVLGEKARVRIRARSTCCR